MDDAEQAPPQEAASESAGADPFSVPESSGADPSVAPEISRRVGSILDAVEREAARLREEAREEAGRYLDHARRRADGLVEERQRRIADLSDELIAKSEAVVARLDDAAPVRQGFENLVRALGDAAERLSRETEDGQGDFETPPFHGAEQGSEGGSVGSSSPSEPPGQTSSAVAGGRQPDHPGEQQQGPPDPYRAPAYQPPPYPTSPEPGRSPAPPAYDPHPGYGAAGGFQQGHQPQPHPARAPSSAGWRGTGEAARAPASPGGGPSWRELDDARMVAIQMAASGATRGAVREHLHRALGIAETTGILDEVFGPSSGEDARVPWTAPQR